MKKHKKNSFLVLSVYLIKNGFAFVLFESALSPHDWGIKEAKKDVGHVKTIASIEKLLAQYRPDILVIDDIGDIKMKSSVRRKRIYKSITACATSLSIETVVVGRKAVRSAFAQFGAVTKHDIAKVIANKMEVFSSRMPDVRAAWQAEDRRMALFDAASRALTYYYTQEQAGI
ncbi:hypothetical protein [Rhodoferax sp. GW822-FHT02A01]|uniref:hypothetical protein n=1 Tax=Rhodoferax sp. GW822-FHT02A01 TaxID=3141537 RepID=UPI00315DA4CE